MTRKIIAMASYLPHSMVLLKKKLKYIPQIRNSTQVKIREQKHFTLTVSKLQLHKFYKYFKRPITTIEHYYYIIGKKTRQQIQDTITFMKIIVLAIVEINKQWQQEILAKNIVDIIVAVLKQSEDHCTML